NTLHFIYAITYSEHTFNINVIKYLTRYVAIMYPLTSSRWTKSYALITVGAIWILGISLASVQLIHSKAEEIVYKNVSYYDCHEVWPNQFIEKLYTMAIFVITFALPMLVLSFTYASIGWKMFRHTSPGNADALRDEAQLMQKTKVVKMLATVVFLFAICWLPLQTFLILHWFRVDFIDTSSDQGFTAYMIIFFVCHWLAMANSCVNPIVYCFMSENFRVT
ncbi:putative G-protein coupled receptor 83-like protein, partial [Leptotrombidium deliense]